MSHRSPESPHAGRDARASLPEASLPGCDDVPPGLLPLVVVAPDVAPCLPAGASFRRPCCGRSRAPVCRDAAGGRRLAERRGSPEMSSHGHPSRPSAQRRGRRTAPARSPPDGLPTPSRGLPAPPRDPHAVGRQRRLRAREQRRALRLLRHGHQPLPHRGGRPGHPRGAGDRRLRRVALPLPRGPHVPRGRPRRPARGQAGSSSVRYELGLFGRAQEAAADGWFVHVFVDRASRRPVPVPEGLRRALERLA